MASGFAEDVERGYFEWFTVSVDVACSYDLVDPVSLLLDDVSLWERLCQRLESVVQRLIIEYDPAGSLDVNVEVVEIEFR